MGVTYSGKVDIRDLLNGSSTQRFTHLAWGAGSASFIDSDFQLGSELFPSGAGTQRNAISSTRIQRNQGVFSSSLEPAQLIGASLFEIGLADSVSGATLETRQTFAKKVKEGTLRIPTDYYYTVGRV